jgi:hypothetical protein
MTLGPQTASVIALSAGDGVEAEIELVVRCHPRVAFQSPAPERTTLAELTSIVNLIHVTSNPENLIGQEPQHSTDP